MFRSKKKNTESQLITDEGYVSNTGRIADIIVITICMIVIFVLMYLGVRLITTTV